MGLKRNNEEIEDFQTGKSELNLHLKKIGDEANHLKEKLRKELAVTKSKLRFYAGVTGIEWDCGTGLDQDSIDGVFTGETRATPFHFDKKQKTSFEITNALWDMIDEGGLEY